MEFFGIGPGELILIGMLALIVFGPGKLPEIAAGAGKAIREFRKVTGEMTREMTQAINIEPDSTGGDAQSKVATEQVNTDTTPGDATTKTCPQCAAGNPSTSKFCNACGVLLP